MLWEPPGLKKWLGVELRSTCSIDGTGMISSQNTYFYLEYHSVCPLTPSPPSEYANPPNAKGRGGGFTLHTRLRAVGESQIGRLAKKISTLSTLWISSFNTALIKLNLINWHVIDSCCPGYVRERIDGSHLGRVFSSARQWVREYLHGKNNLSKRKQESSSIILLLFLRTSKPNVC
jgi:hypothetical protein